MSARTEDEEMDHIGAEVSSTLKTKARVAAAEEDLSMSEWLRGLIRDEVQD